MDREAEATRQYREEIQRNSAGAFPVAGVILAAVRPSERQGPSDHALLPVHLELVAVGIVAPEYDEVVEPLKLRRFHGVRAQPRVHGGNGVSGFKAETEMEPCRERVECSRLARAPDRVRRLRRA